MPTNPSWIEHTEKAAWETVNALREQVAEERARADRLIRLEPTLPRLGELLDEARARWGLTAPSPVGMIEELLARLDALAAERDALREELAARATPVEATEEVATSDPGAAPRKRPNALRWFASQLGRHRRERDDELEPLPSGLAETATWVEERLRALTPLPYAPSALYERALDLGLAAFALARAARRAERAS